MFEFLRFVDVVIVGSGFIGVMMSYYMYEYVWKVGRDIKVVMFEVDEFCGGVIVRNGELLLVFLW